MVAQVQHHHRLASLDVAQDPLPSRPQFALGDVAPAAEVVDVVPIRDLAHHLGQGFLLHPDLDPTGLVGPQVLGVGPGRLQDRISRLGVVGGAHQVASPVHDVVPVEQPRQSGVVDHRPQLLVAPGGIGE